MAILVRFQKIAYNLAMDSQKEYLSREKYEALKEELVRLKTSERKEVAERLEYAKSLGDLSENAEYHEARDQQADIEDRIAQIEEMLKNAVIVTDKHGQEVEIGSTVVVQKDGGREDTYTIVGSEEADMLSGKISFQSPIGGALLGKRKGEEVLVQTPKGETKYSIVEVK
jgi:transcription elongation factor GreA